MARIPDSIDKYKLESLIASGGMAHVYKGMHPTLERPVILKKLSLRGDAAFAERFRREARILMDFRSDYIVDVYDHFKKGSNHYIVMEYVDGLSVQQLLLRERYFDNALCAYIALSTAKALAYAHGKNVIHRDIKPDNVLVSKQGDVKLADFGIASSREDDSNLTSAGMTLGTPSYMAPEQFADSRTVDGRADLYSLGVMLYELLTGRKPFPGRFSPDLVRAIEKGVYKKPRRINPAVAPELQRVVAMVMKPNPHRRCGDAGEIIERLQRFLDRYDEKAVKARLVALVAGTDFEPVVPGRSGKRARRIVIGVVAALVCGTIIAWSALTGTYKRVFAPAAYGEVRFVVEGFKGEIAPGDLHITVFPAAEAYDSTAGDTVRVMPLLNRFPGDAPSIIVTSFPMAMTAGEYRATARMGDREVEALFSVGAWKGNRKETTVVLPVIDSEPRPLRVTVEITDAVTGDDLTGAAIVDVLRGNSYVPIGSAGQILSGRVTTFRIWVAGYPAKTIVVDPARETGSLTISVQLQHVGGKK